MPRRLKLTWQRGTNGRAGRWRKKYRNRSYYFPGGRGKSDRQAYEAAVAAWEKKKVEIDASSPKPHQADYERALEEWEAVLTWCRKHDDEEFASVATAKLVSLRAGLAERVLEPLAKHDTLNGQFDIAVRHPKFASVVADAASTAKEAMNSASPFVDSPEYQDMLAANKRFLNDVAGPLNDSTRTLVLPKAMIGPPDDLAVEREIWRDRLEVMQRSAGTPEATVKGQIQAFLAGKKADVVARQVTAGRYGNLQAQLRQFQDWLGAETPVAEISGQILVDYRAFLLNEVHKGNCSATTANERMGAVKSFVRWLWQMEVIPSLPRVMDSQSRQLEIGKSNTKIEVFEKTDIHKMLMGASNRTKLYILLMLNCGMTQKDIADLDQTEVDWEKGRITRKRSKTRNVNNVPKVSYLLWPETLELLKQERASVKQGRVLLNENGRPLWYEELADDGKYKKNDNVRNAFERLRRKLNINKPLKSLKKTSASLIAGNKEYKGLEDLFLGHAPTKMSDRHYAKPPEDLLDEATQWLRAVYEVPACFVPPSNG